jgi:hypothetical protein
LTGYSGQTSKNERSTEYPNLPSALRQGGQSLELPVLERPESWDLGGDAELNLGNREMDVENVLPYSDEPSLVHQVELYDILRG